MSVFSLNAIGIDVRHTGEFIIDRPDGSGDMLLIIFRTDAVLRLDGIDTPVRPGSAVIFAQGSEQYYRSCSDLYINHFLHFSVSDSEDLSSITTDTLLFPHNILEAEELLRMISREQFSVSRNRNAYISSLIQMLMMKLSETDTSEECRPASPHTAALDSLRAEIYSNPAKYENIKQIAESVSISPSHFQYLYRSQFGVSCYEDLLTAKIKTAEYYLGSTTLSVKEIALLCGYSNVTCFLHRFRDRTGHTPSEYRSMRR